VERFLRRYPDFTRLWIGQTLSQLGSQVTLVALPLLAISTLDASTLQVGLLAGAETVPFLVLGLPAGVWVDRRRRRPVLMYADVGRGLLLATIPIAYAFDVLSMGQLYVVAVGVGACTVLFDVAYLSYVPSLVPPADLLAANTRMEVSYSAAGLVGPGLGGILVQALRAATAMVVDAISYLASAIAILRIRTPEPEPAPAAETTTMTAAAKEGIRYVFRHPLLVWIALYAALFNLFSGMSMAVFLVYAVRQLDVSAATIGLIFSAGGLGAIVGTVLTERAGQRWGVGTSLSVGATVASTAFLLVPAAPPSSPVPFFLAAMILESCFNPLWNVTQLSLRQIVTPPHLHGRMTATMRFLVWGALPLGSLLGGILGDQLGLRDTLWVAAIGSALAAAPVVLGPLRKLKEMPEPAATTTG
jgi:MFS family permease